MHDGAMVTDQYPLLSLREALMTTYLEVFPAPRIAEQLSELPDGAYVGITCSPTNCSFYIVLGHIYGFGCFYY